MSGGRALTIACVREVPSIQRDLVKFGGAILGAVASTAGSWCTPWGGQVEPNPVVVPKPTPTPTEPPLKEPVRNVKKLQVP
jgi:hypothetical protein